MKMLCYTYMNACSYELFPWIANDSFEDMYTYITDKFMGSKTSSVILLDW